MDEKTMHAKNVFTREEIARAYEVARDKIIGAHLIHGVEREMDLHGLSEVNMANLSGSERECIEWGLINE